MTGKLIAGIAAVGLAGAAAYFYMKNREEQTVPAAAGAEGRVVEDRSIHYSNAPTTHNNVTYNLPEGHFQEVNDKMPGEDMFKPDIDPNAGQSGSEKTNVDENVPVTVPKITESTWKAPTYEEALARAKAGGYSRYY